MEDAVLVFSRSESGNVAPLRVIQGPRTQIRTAQGLDVDTVNNEIAVVNEATRTITIYRRLDVGDVEPLRTISDATGSLSRPVGIAIDPVNNEIVVTDDGRDAQLVQVYPRDADGPTPPRRQIMGPSTMLDRVRQVTVDTVNNEIIVASQGDRATDPPVLGAVVVFDRLADEDATPKRFIRHVKNSGVRHPRSVWVDTDNDEIGEGDSKGNDIRIFERFFSDPQ
jgi:DNA-binding beta-propeller fold protein YncE